jgi:hypothetical protein
MSRNLPVANLFVRRSFIDTNGTSRLPIETMIRFSYAVAKSRPGARGQNVQVFGVSRVTVSGKGVTAHNEKTYVMTDE